jgi:predicted dehydrogenase/threonine dehydrogenase-like Zn-dependent dehydrogenase
MKQVVIRKGSPLVVDVPPAAALPGFVLVGLRASCVSPGTEMAGIAASGQGLLQRALAKPEKLKMAWSQARRDGFATVWKKVRQGLEREQLCGYSAAGVVLDVGPGVDGFTRGMRVAVAGAGMANHAELVAVPVNLAVPIPDGVGFDEASTVALGGIAMQGVRRAHISLGERVAVIGCGAIGMLGVQLLRAAGCRVFATDLDDERLALAGKLGAEVTANPASGDVVRQATHWSEGHGVDAVLVFAATSSAEPVSQAFRMSRRKGRVVLVGVAGGEYKREDMYAKELDFVISTSYGPGRYDEDYELRGRDYPFGYVRWTEKRNMGSYLDLIAGGAVDVKPLIGVREALENAPVAYEKLKSPERPMLAVLECGEDDDDGSGRFSEPSLVSGKWTAPEPGQAMGLALAGAGAFVQGMHIPILQSMGGKVTVPWSCSRTGTGARASTALLASCRPTTDFAEVLADPAVHAVLIGTRHNTHAELAIRALKAGKGVFLEKPMCLTAREFDDLREAVEQSDAPFMVGYNRRFSPFADILRRETAKRVHPLMIHYSMNAGYLPVGHWTQTEEGGGRLLGEACHIVDLFRSVVGHPVESVSCHPLRGGNRAAFPTDNFSLTLSYADGSVASLLYTALGHPGLPKERMELFFDEKAVVLDDYLSMEAHGIPGAALTLKQRDKGHAAEIEAFHAAVTGGSRFPIPWEEMVETWQVTHRADEICRTGEAVERDS